MIDEAVRDNAEWCGAMCRAHGLTGTFTERVWAGSRRTPPLYPDAVTLTPDASVRDVLDRIDTVAPWASVKDSFARLDLSGHGFRVLFEASWIHRAADAPAPSATSPWTPVTTADGLAAWERAWGGGEHTGLFRPELLADPTVTVLGGTSGGAVLTHGGPVVGVSNLFGPAPDRAWADCLAFAAARWPGTPVVGYEGGDDLAHALRAGFTELGPLRVWLADD
ncbi:hypothetical protein ABT160_00925 [Streptomyces sp. NPDC001941]|uniref:hypothetical protein n=1 Tax=Streptomyces sp. NPDC001941 TaxID=3154659 RepID=UPI003331E08F